MRFFCSSSIVTRSTVVSATAIDHVTTTKKPIIHTCIVRRLVINQFIGLRQCIKINKIYTTAKVAQVEANLFGILVIFAHLLQQMLNKTIFYLKITVKKTEFHDRKDEIRWRISTLVNVINMRSCACFHRFRVRSR